jgi:hypothetical protein
MLILIDINTIIGLIDTIMIEIIDTLMKDQEEIAIMMINTKIDRKLKIMEKGLKIKIHKLLKLNYPKIIQYRAITV